MVCPLTSLNCEISSNGSRCRVSRVGGTEHLTACNYCVFPLPDHGNYGAYNSRIVQKVVRLLRQTIADEPY